MSARPDPRPPARRIPVARPEFGPGEEEAVLEVLRSGWVAQGPRVEAFEQEFADAVGAGHGVALSSGTTALFLALHASDIGPGDEVLVPSLSFIASANAISQCGATPVFVDVEPGTYNVDAATLEAALTPRVRAIMVVHQLGMPADLDRIEALAQRHGLLIVEDAACAAGSEYKGQPIGGSGHAVCFSFHPRKLVVCGEGGMITTNDPALAGRLRRLRHQGMSLSDLERHLGDRVQIEQYPEIGYNFRLSDLHAALGRVQLSKLARFVDGRRAIAARYRAGLEALPGVVLPSEPDFARSNWQSYIVRLRDASEAQRNAALDAMLARGIATRRGLMASHLEPCYRGARTAGPLPETEAAAAQTLVLPIYAGLGEDDQAYVIEQLGLVIAELAPEVQRP